MRAPTLIGAWLSRRGRPQTERLASRAPRRRPAPRATPPPHALAQRGSSEVAVASLGSIACRLPMPRVFRAPAVMGGRVEGRPAGPATGEERQTKVRSWDAARPTSGHAPTANAPVMSPVTVDAPIKARRRRRARRTTLHPSAFPAGRRRTTRTSFSEAMRRTRDRHRSTPRWRLPAHYSLPWRAAHCSMAWSTGSRLRPFGVSA